MSQFGRISGWFRRRFRPSARQMAANRLYHCIVQQSRSPGFYNHAGVADTVDGRFDMIVVHAFIVMHRLRDGDKDAADLSQALFDEMFMDMDRSLREMGVGDMGIGRRVRAMGTAFLGRVDAYHRALEAGGDELERALMRNLYRSEASPEAGACAIGRYVRSKVDLLSSASLTELLEGHVAFGPALQEDTL